MTSILTFFISCVSFLLVFVVQPIQAQFGGPERLQNGGFESCDLAPGWAARPGPTFDGSVSSTVAHTGNCSLELKVLDVVQQSFQQPVSTQGILTFWLRAPNNRCASLSALVEYGDQTSDSQSFACTPDWTQFTFRFDAAKGVSAIGFATGEVAGEMYVDDVGMPGVLPERDQLPDSLLPGGSDGGRAGGWNGARLCQFLFRGNKTYCILGAIVATLAGLGGLLFLYRKLRASG